MLKHACEIEAEIGALKDLRSHLHHALRSQIDISIDVLTERMTLSGIEDAYGDDVGEQETLTTACDAYRWMIGVSAEAPSIGWRNLV